MCRLSKKAFTLVEMLIVLAIISVLSILAFSYGEKGMKEQHIEHFFEQLINDALYLQQYAINEKSKMDIKFDLSKKEYVGAKRTSSNAIFKRTIPQEIDIHKNSTIRTISFNEQGNASFAGKIIFQIDKEKRELYVYVGSGRIDIKK